MTVLDLYHDAAQRGLTLKAVGPDKLAVIPARLCSPEFADMLRRHKEELLAMLSGAIDKIDLHSGAPTTFVQPVVKPHRPLSNHERTLLVRFCGNENDPIIITALNLFNGTIVG
jgi:hypothetical protein